MTPRMILCGMALGATALWLPAAWPTCPLLVYNPSDSMPLGWYLVEPVRTWHKDDLVVARLRPAASVLAAQRGYLPVGTPVLKRVAAVAPQSVCVRGALVYIDGVEMAHVLPQDSAHRPLQAWAECRKLGADELFLLGDGDAASFDSRYAGPVGASDVIGAARPLWTWRAGEAWSR
jgi:conjugative transfer signal peptidase TraF